MESKSFRDISQVILEDLNFEDLDIKDQLDHMLDLLVKEKINEREGGKMIWQEKVIKSTELNELIIYLSGLLRSRVIKATLLNCVNNGNYVKDIYFIQEEIKKMNEKNIRGGVVKINLEFEHGKSLNIEIEKLSPSLTHYIVKNLDDELESSKYIFGMV